MVKKCSLMVVISFTVIGMACAVESSPEALQKLNGESAAVAQLQARYDYFLRLPDAREIPLFQAEDNIVTTLPQNEEHPEEYQKEIQARKVTDYAVTTEHGITIPVRLYENDSPNLIVLALGKGANIKDTERFVRALCPMYSVVTFNYEWHDFSSVQWGKTPFQIGKAFFDHNHEEVVAVVKFVRDLKAKGQAKFEQVIGLGECYSTLTFARAQAISCQKNEPLFDKLILDSAFYSVKACAEAIIKDPWLMYDNFEGGCPSWIQAICGHWMILTPSTTVLGLFLPDASVEQYLKEIRETPILFIRGQNDTFVLPQYFELLWGAVQHKKKAVFFTPFNHSNSFERKKARKQYLCVIDKFINNDFDRFIQVFN